MVFDWVYCSHQIDKHSGGFTGMKQVPGRALRQSTFLKFGCM